MSGTRAAEVPQPIGLVGRVVLVGLIVAGAILSAGDLISLMLFGAYVAVGAVLGFLRPRNVVGWLVIAISFEFVATTAPPDAAIAAYLHGEASPRDTLMLWLAGWTGLGAYVGFLALTIVFPEGRLPGTGRRTSVALLAAGIAVVILAAFAPTFGVTLSDGITTVTVSNPFPVLPTLPIWAFIPIQALAFPIAIALLMIGVVRMVLRYRRATGVERLQLRWLVAAVVFMFAALIFGFGVIIVLGESAFGFGWLPALIAYPTIPLAIGVAVLRYRLLEIDRIISRTIAYGLVTGLLVATYAGLILVLQGPLGLLTGSDTILVAGSTLIVAALFQPVRRWVQKAVDRRFDRARYDGERVVAGFSERLRHELDLQALAAEVDRVAAETVRPTRSAVWLRTSPRDPVRRTTP